MSKETIIAAKNLGDVLSIVKEVHGQDDDTLVVFDIDGVLLRPSPLRLYFGEQLYRNININHEKKDLLKQILKKISNERIRFQNEHQLNGKKDLEALINFLQEKQMKSICLTHLGSGDNKFYHDQKPIRIEDWRIENLKPYHTYFLTQHTSLCKNDNQIGFDTPLCTTNSKVLFKNGILFVGDENTSYDKAEKGYVLVKFLETIEYLPKKVIFVDDLLSNVSSVAAACKILGIEYIGIHHQREYTPKFLSQQFLDHCKSFINTGIMQNDDSDTEVDEDKNTTVIDKVFYDTMRSLDTTLSALGEAINYDSFGYWGVD